MNAKYASSLPLCQRGTEGDFNGGDTCRRINPPCLPFCKVGYSAVDNFLE